MYIDNTTVNTSISSSTTSTTSTIYLGGFFGYIGTSTFKAYITNSIFTNVNANSEVDCLYS